MTQVRGVMDRNIQPTIEVINGEIQELEKLNDASCVMAARHRDTRVGELSACRHHYTDGGISNETRKDDICSVNSLFVALSLNLY